MTDTEFLVNHFLAWVEPLPVYMRDEDAIDRIISDIEAYPDQYAEANWPSIYRAETTA